jgi:DNA-binding response OmpR family regulator
VAARIRALVRRGSSSSPPILTWGALSLDPSSCEVAYQGQRLHPSRKEYCLLELFYAIVIVCLVEVQL